MNRVLRCKFEGAKILEVDIDALHSFKIDKEEGTDYYLMAYTNDVGYVLAMGSLTKCHTMLSQIHTVLNLDVIDLEG